MRLLEQQLSNANVVIDLLDKYKSILIAQPDLAQTQLDEILDELSNIYKNLAGNVDV